MKFFKHIILISSFLAVNLVYPCDVQGTPEPSHLLSYQYSRHHNLPPKNVDPNISYLILESPFAITEMFDLSISSPIRLYSMMEDTLHAYVYDLYSLHLSRYERFHYHIFELSNLDNVVGYLLEEHGIDTLLTIQYDSSNYLMNENSYDILTYRKFKTFIETKVTAMKLQGFNL